MELRCVCAARNAWKSALAYETAAQRRVVAEMLRGDESRVEADGSAVQGGIGSCGHRVVEVAAWPCVAVAAPCAYEGLSGTISGEGRRR